MSSEIETHDTRRQTDALLAREVRYRYPRATSDAVAGVSLRIVPGERVCVLGANGCGKSTLLAMFSGSLRPLSGEVEPDQSDPDSPLSIRVRQDPVTQVVSSVVLDDVEFGPLNLGLERSRARSLALESLAGCGISELAARGTSELSGGQLQLVVLAGALAMRPGVLVLDEVTSQLDAVASSLVREIVSRACDHGVGVVEVTHSLSDLIGADRAVIMEKGRLAWEGTVDGLLGDASLIARAQLGCEGLGCALPVLERAGWRSAMGLDHDRMLGLARDAGLRDELLDALPDDVVVAAASTKASCDRDSRAGLQSSGMCPGGRPALELRDACVRYGGVEALREVSLALRPGRVTLVAGESGCGKTTLLRVMSGTLAPDSGSALLCGWRVRPGDVGLCFQRPESQLFCDTLWEDVAMGPRNLGLGEDGVVERAREALCALGIEGDLWDRHPLALSGGQRRLAAIAGVVAMGSPAVLLDEPTAGLDADARRRVHGLVRDLAERGVAVCVVSHDVVEWLCDADDVALMRDGVVAWEGDASDVMACAGSLEAAGLAAPCALALARACVAEAVAGSSDGGGR